MCHVLVNESYNLRIEASLESLILLKQWRRTCKAGGSNEVSVCVWGHVVWMVQLQDKDLGSQDYEDIRAGKCCDDSSIDHDSLRNNLLIWFDWLALVYVVYVSVLMCAGTVHTVVEYRQQKQCSDLRVWLGSNKSNLLYWTLLEYFIIYLSIPISMHLNRHLHFYTPGDFFSWTKQKSWDFFSAVFYWLFVILRTIRLALWFLPLGKAWNEIKRKWADEKLRKWKVLPPDYLTCVRICSGKGEHRLLPGRHTCSTLTH